MKKNLWMGVAILAIGFSVGMSFCAFAESGQTNCIGDSTGMTNCASGHIQEKPEEDTATQQAKMPIEVDKTKLEFGKIIEAGRRYSQTITVKNTTNDKMTIRVEAVNYNGEKSEDDEEDVVDWIVFGGAKRRFELNGGKSFQLSVRLMLPAEVKGGTYYAKIKISNGKEEDDQYVTVKADVALEGYRYDGKLVSQNVGFVNLGETVSAEAQVKNEGTAGFASHYSVRYKNAFGLPEWKQVVEEEREVLPGTEERFEVNKENSPVIGYGFFTVEQKISYINAENRQVEAVLSHVVINMPWWALAIAGGVLLVVLVLVVVLIRRHKKAEEQEELEKARSAKKRKKKVTIEVREDE